MPCDILQNKTCPFAMPYVPFSVAIYALLHGVLACLAMPLGIVAVGRYLMCVARLAEPFLR